MPTPQEGWNSSYGNGARRPAAARPDAPIPEQREPDEPGAPPSDSPGPAGTPGRPDGTAAPGDTASDDAAAPGETPPGQSGRPGDRWLTEQNPWAAPPWPGPDRAGPDLAGADRSVPDLTWVVPRQRTGAGNALEWDVPSAAPPGSPPGLPPAPPPPEPPPFGGTPRRTLLLVAVGLVLLLGAAVGTTALLISRADREQGSASAAARDAAVPPPVSSLPGGPAVPNPPTGTATLANPTVTTEKDGYQDPARWCSLLTPDDIREVTGFPQQGSPDSRLLCTHHLDSSTGYVFVSDIPAAQGAPYTVRGNTAILYQSDPTACEVSVVLNRGGEVLDIDLRGVMTPRVPLCQAVAELAGRAFDRLPGR